MGTGTTRRRIRGTTEGTVTLLEPSELPINDDFDVTVFEGASSGLLTPDDLEEAGAAAQLVARRRLHVQALIAVLDATEPAA